MYKAYITKIKNIRPHPNADRLNLAECFGNTVIIGKDYDENTLYIYFPTDGQLSEEYATINNLVRKKDDAGNQIGGYLDPDKRNITAIRLRGEKSDGLVMPLSSLESFGDISSLKQGHAIDVFNGHLICNKYIPKRNYKTTESNGNKTRKRKVPVAPLFSEHADTEQLAYNLSAFKPGDQIEITLKIHGTSQRTGYLPVLKGYKKSILDFILSRPI
jgi:RNA ligase (TIGR02306 family)